LVTETVVKSGLSRRRRRALWTALVILFLLVAGSIVAAVVYRHRRVSQYKPGEENADITASLARDLPADAPKPKFTDVTAEAGLADFVTFAGDRTSQLPEDMGPGTAWGDVNNDGYEDLFLVSAGGPLDAPADRLAPSLLYENLGNGRFRRVADFPDVRIHGMGAAWGDYDNDGWVDLIVTGYDDLLLFHNDHGRLTLDKRLQNRKGFWSGAAWGDYDNDGFLDLYICGYVKYAEPQPGQGTATQQFGVAVPFTLNPASFEPERNLLFHNTGHGTFEEVGDKLGVSDRQGRSLSAVWHDFDDDGWLDLYVANDISHNVLYHNVRGRFDDISEASWIGEYRGSMGLAVGDWNRDGDDDVFITHWLAQENALYESLLKEGGVGGNGTPTPPSAYGAAKKQGQRGGLRFVDSADMVGLGQIALPVVGWGTEFADFDGDGWLDLVVANGSTLETAQTPKRLIPELPFLFWNRRGEFFHNLAPLVPALSQPRVARGLAVADYDNDGDADVLIVRRGGPVQLLRNDMQTGHWAEVELRARPGKDGPTRPALGAQAIAQVGPLQLRRGLTSASYLSQSSAVLHFGLGTAGAIDRLDVRWRGDGVAAYATLSAGKRWIITEGDPAPREDDRRPAGAAESASADRDRTLAFWDRQHAAMQALKVDHDLPKATRLFREALALDPAHEDAHYYLGDVLRMQGDAAGALAEYETLTRLNPQSHRGFARWGTLRAMTSTSPADLAAAEGALEKAHRLNPEETGALLALGEVALMRGERPLAAERLAAVCRTNPRASGGLFLLGYLKWTQGDTAGAKEMLGKVRQALGPEWKPAGSTAEGDVAATHYSESTPLARFWEAWNGVAEPRAAFAALDGYLKRL
jgi:enediyne biosynthesis protein E4